ncbi:MAG: zf-TFIIB domain-containing protein [Actinobacteria bacterium]|nr:zf-TFIIB domain-containing protein [Actinomycetota bacterium]
MVDIHYCENCDEHEAEVVLTGPGGETKYLCTAPECMMAAGICPSCQVELEITVTETGEKLYQCPQCDFEQTYRDLGQA